MKIIKLGTPRQLLYLTCHTCGCEFEIYDEEIVRNMEGSEVLVKCPCCGVYLYDLRDKVEVKDGCLHYKCARLSCDGCEWEE